jgi:hypothetical protein
MAKRRSGKRSDKEQHGETKRNANTNTNGGNSEDLNRAETGPLKERRKAVSIFENEIVRAALACHCRAVAGSSTRARTSFWPTLRCVWLHHFLILYE